eukprot:767722-Hanusia_phi.AAC.5
MHNDTYSAEGRSRSWEEGWRREVITVTIRGKEIMGHDNADALVCVHVGRKVRKPEFKRSWSENWKKCYCMQTSCSKMTVGARRIDNKHQRSVSSSMKTSGKGDHVRNMLWILQR